ncbi:MAG: crossover junction endodeoxyribonuclease RuvC [Deltaproteobacteria bacterium]|nr:crossover junction endodeoxyribonuclease RuvC [Deltaproteobacteria bacterium]NIS76473.1 crossover junction endodeoxyribonuclease RuvC [Deltaproteobacteria bacterium]
MFRILGIDPGSISTGVGIVDFEGKTPHHVFHTVLRVSAKQDFPSRIDFFHKELTRIIDSFEPKTAALEKVFISTNPSSALKLGLIRGVIMLSCRIKELEIIEVSTREMKVSLTGYGAADKKQVASMVKRILGISEKLSHDESDALAIAISAGYETKSRVSAHKLSSESNG